MLLINIFRLNLKFPPKQSGKTRKNADGWQHPRLQLTKVQLQRNGQASLRRIATELEKPLLFLSRLSSQWNF
jgi:hypothetical protein